MLGGVQLSVYGFVEVDGLSCWVFAFYFQFLSEGWDAGVVAPGVAVVKYNGIRLVVVDAARYAEWVEVPADVVCDEAVVNGWRVVFSRWFFV